MSTSRIGRKPVQIPPGVVINFQNQELSISGPKGKMQMLISSNVSIELEDKILKVIDKKDGYVRSGSGSKLNKSIVGTVRAKIDNMVIGVTNGFIRKLVLVGVGYRAQAAGKVLNLTVGYSHPVAIQAPEGITFETPSQTEILVKGVDKHLVGHIASKIRDVRSPEPYKGKGIRYANEVIVRKETKKK